MEKTDNELIAEFMGYTFHEKADFDYSDCGGIYTTEHVWCKQPIKKEFDYLDLEWKWSLPSGELLIGDLKYDLSFDWIIPVVQKIESLSELLPNYDDNYEEVLSLPLSSPILVVHEKVASFVKWYNSTKP